jgi:arginine exporter protein ArgO
MVSLALVMLGHSGRSLLARQKLIFSRSNIHKSELHFCLVGYIFHFFMIEQQHHHNFSLVWFYICISLKKCVCLMIHASSVSFAW